SRRSTAGPNANSAIEFAARWKRPPCTNMYVRKVHIRPNAVVGSKRSQSMTAGAVNSVSVSSSTTALIASRRPTQGVIRDENDRPYMPWIRPPGAVGGPRIQCRARDALAQLPEGDPDRRRRLRQQRGRGHPRQGVHLQTEHP